MQSLCLIDNIAYIDSFKEERKRKVDGGIATVPFKGFEKMAGWTFLLLKIHASKINSFISS